MKKKIFVLCIALMTFVVQIPVAPAQQTTPSPQDWAAVQAIPAGEEIVVEKKDGATVKGKLNSSTASLLSVSGKTGVTNIDQSNVRRVYRTKGRSRGKSALIGAGIGAAAGGGGGALLYAQDPDDMVGVIIPLFAIAGAGIGAGIGAIFGGKRKRVLIYEAK